MTKDQLQAELKAKVKAGVKPSDLKKLKRSKSADDIPSSLTPNIPLKKSQSQLNIPLPQPTLTQQISSLQDELTTERKRVSSLREDLSSSQDKTKQLKEKINQIEEQILQLRLDKIKDFGDYLEKKGQLETELEENIKAGTQEINRLETKLLATNKKKLALQSQLNQTQTTNTKLELQLLNNEPSSNPNLL